MTSMPNSFNFSLFPMPDTLSKCGEPIDPADKITSLLALDDITLSP